MKHDSTGWTGRSVKNKVRRSSIDVGDILKTVLCIAFILILVLVLLIGIIPSEHLVISIGIASVISILQVAFALWVAEDIIRRREYDLYEGETHRLHSELIQTTENYLRILELIIIDNNDILERFNSKSQAVIQILDNEKLDITLSLASNPNAIRYAPELAIIAAHNKIIDSRIRRIVKILDSEIYGTMFPITQRQKLNDVSVCVEQVSLVINEIRNIEVSGSHENPNFDKFKSVAQHAIASLNRAARAT